MPNVTKKPSILWPLAAIGGAVGLVALAARDAYSPDYMPKIPKLHGPDDDDEDEKDDERLELPGLVLGADDVQRSKRIDCGGAPCFVWFNRPRGSCYTSKKLKGTAGGAQTEIVHDDKRTYIGWKFWRAGTAVIQVRQDNIYSAHWILDLRNVGRSSTPIAV